MGHAAAGRRSGLAAALDGQCADGSLTLRLGDAGADIGRVLWSAADGQGALEGKLMAYACLALNESRTQTVECGGIWPMLMGSFLGDFTAFGLSNQHASC